MSYNSFGQIFKFTSWGESHGIAIGCVVDGVPSNIEIDEAYIQNFLDRRKPGQSKFTTQRNEEDKVEILSGVFEGKTTGTPISLIIRNADQRSKDYSDIKDKFRPSHADYTYFIKYGNRDYRGGGRSSARETAVRVAAGAIAHKVLEQKNIKICGAMIQLGDDKINYDNWDDFEINNNDFFCPDKITVKRWEDKLLKIRKDGSSIGAIVEIRATNVFAGIGAPLYNKLDANLASAMMSINAVKGVEIGAGFASSQLTGEENADEIFMDGDGKVNFSNNNAGGILGGISSGQDIVVKFVVKPTSSILKPRKTIDKYGNNTEIITKGRHDPCVGIRAVPVGEAMMACVLLDQILLSNAYNNLIL